MPSSIVVAAACLVVFAASVAAMGLFSSKNQMPVEGKTVVLTGATEGMGRCVARILAAKGANVVLVSRNVQRLEETLAEIKAAAKNPSTQRFHCISRDVSDPGFAAPLLAEITSWNSNRSPDVVWCVAGLATTGLFTDVPFDSLRRNMDINFFGTAELAHAVLSAWLAPASPVEPQPRHLVLTSSLVSFFSPPGYAAYAPSKAALRALADTLSLEVDLYPQNVRVHTVYPGTMTSPGLERENATKPEITHMLEADDPVVSPERMAEVAVAGLERGQYAVVTGLQPLAMRWSVLGGMLRNNWLVDTLMAMLMPLAWLYFLPMMQGMIRRYGREHGHPGTYAKRT